MEKEITIIMPLYKGEKTLKRALASVLQQTIVDKLHTVIVVDGEIKEQYDTLIRPFRSLMSVEVIYLETNHGPGYARQAGLDNTSTPYVMFLDSDDTFVNAYACGWILKTIKEDALQDVQVVVGQIYEEASTDLFGIKKDDFAWLGGKIFKVDYLKKHHITFPPTYIGEDVAFLKMIQFAEDPTRPFAGALDTPIYFWHNAQGSTMRPTTDESQKHLRFVKSPKGVHDAVRHVVKFCYDNNTLNEHVYSYIISMFIYYYVLYDFVQQAHPEYKEDILSYACSLYRLFILIPPDFLSEQEDNIFAAYYVNALQQNMSAPYRTTILYDEFKKLMPDLAEVLSENIKLNN